VKLFKAILLLMVLACVVATTMVGTLAVSNTRDVLVRDAQELAQERVKQVSLKAVRILEEPSRAAMGLARIPGFFQLPLAEQQSHITAVLNQTWEITALTVFDKKHERVAGLQAFAVKDIPPTEVAEHEARARKLVEALGTREAYSAAYRPPSSGMPSLTLAFPVGDPVKGYVAAEISLRALAEMLAQERVGSNGFAYVTDLEGRLVAGGHGLGDAQIGGDLSARRAVAQMKQMVGDSASSELLHVGNYGDEPGGGVVVAFSVLPELHWATFSEQPMELAYKQVGTMKRGIVVSALAAILVAATLAWFFSRNLTRPLRGLMASALEIAQGKFGVQAAIRSRNELGELARTFNYMSQVLLAYDGENKRLYESLEKGYLETIVALANSIDQKDPYTRGHSQRVGDLAVEIGQEIGLTPLEIKQLRYGGILHDIGKIGIVDSILSKSTPLTAEEMVAMREHPAIGDTIIQPVTFLSTVRSTVRNHHENWDGTGYPDRLRGEAIPLAARIVAVADTFDACTSTRPYQKAMSVGEAMQILERLSGIRLDPGVVAALRRVLQKSGAKVEGRAEPVKLAG
jgi:HD-GYP domain-containing protein (c-di-GMP phosphodiesterase class II)